MRVDVIHSTSVYKVLIGTKARVTLGDRFQDSYVSATTTTNYSGVTVVHESVKDSKSTFRWSRVSDIAVLTNIRIAVAQNLIGDDYITFSV